MMIRDTLLRSTCLGALVLAPALGWAQAGGTQGQNQGQTQAQGQAGQGQSAQGQSAQGQAAQGQSGQAQSGQGGQQVAEACLRDLGAFRQRVSEDGYWLSGYREGIGWGGRWGTGAMGIATPTAASTQANGTQSSGTQSSGTQISSGDRDIPPGNPGNVGARSGPHAMARAADAQTGAQPAPAQAMAGGGAAAPAGSQAGSQASPWSSMDWRMAPGEEMRVLYGAASILGHRGEEQGCRAVLTSLRQTHDRYARELRAAGVEPGQVVGYRQQQLATAQPVTEVGRSFRADTITGTDVRNPRDAYLGSVDDVVLDPRTGRISHVILSRGGFLGLGDEHVAVPWQRLQVTRGMDLFVLDATEAMLERAPRVDAGAFSNAASYDRRRQEIDSFWQRQQGGNRAG